MTALARRIVWHFYGAYRVTDRMLDGANAAIREEAASG